MSNRKKVSKTENSNCVKLEKNPRSCIYPYILAMLLARRIILAPLTTQYEDVILIVSGTWIVR
jgi:hypothetical protein